jgi:anti-sigma B factor antagonist
MFDLSSVRDMDNDVVRITVSGEIDLLSAPDFKRQLYESVGEGGTDVVVECSELAYIDSTGLGILLGMLKRVRTNSHQVYIRNLKDSIRKLFRITGLDKAFVLEEAQ